MDKDFDNNFSDIKKNIYLFEDPINNLYLIIYTLSNTIHYQFLGSLSIVSSIEG